jgi:hypothetical protein
MGVYWLSVTVRSCTLHSPTAKTSEKQAMPCKRLERVCIIYFSISCTLRISLKLFVPLLCRNSVLATSYPPSLLHSPPLPHNREPGNTIKRLDNFRIFLFLYFRYSKNIFLVICHTILQQWWFLATSCCPRTCDLQSPTAKTIGKWEMSKFKKGEIFLFHHVRHSQNVFLICHDHSVAMLLWNIQLLLLFHQLHSIPIKV